MIVRNDIPAGAVRGDYRAPLDGLRALAFLSVFLFHANSGRFPAGALGVPVFFVLSGFLITRVLLKNEGPTLAGGLRNFYIRRALRICPLYYVVVLTFHALGLLQFPWLIYFHVYNLGVYTQGRFIGCYGHFWTLAVEEQFYLVYPLVLLATPGRRRALVLASLVVICAASRYLLEWFASGPFVSVLPNVAGEYLVAGSIAGYVDHHRPGIAFSRVRLGLAIAAASWVVLRTSGLPLGDPWVVQVMPDVAAVAFAVLVWEIWRVEGALGRALSARPLVYLGKISYGCYIFHAFALQLSESLLRSLGASNGLLALKMRTPLAFVATIVVATASWHLLESPILRLKGRFDYRPRSCHPAASRSASTSRAEAVVA